MTNSCRVHTKKSKLLSFSPHRMVSFLTVMFAVSRYYAPALGFLMFAVGVNSSEKDFLEAFKKPAAIFAGYIGQFALKPLLGYLFGTVAMSVLGLPTSLGKISDPFFRKENSMLTKVLLSVYQLQGLC